MADATPPIVVLKMIFTAIAVLMRVLSNPLANVFQKSLTGKGAHPVMVNFLTYLGLGLICIFGLRPPFRIHSLVIP